MRWQWIADDQRLQSLVADHRGATEVAMDTEFRRRDTFFPQVALLQLCWNDEAYLIDPTAISDPSPVVELLTDPGVTKYLHSASEDLEVFDCWLGQLPVGLFDTQRAAGLCGRDPGISYRGIVAELLQIEVPKDETQSDWLKRPLSDAQLTYAAMDVVYLLTVGRQLRADLEARGRLAWVFEDSARMAPGGRGPLAKFKTAWKLNARQRAALLALVDWRDQRARELDKPRSWIVDDKALLGIAIRLPASPQELSRVDGVSDAVVRRQGKALLACIAPAVAGETDCAWTPAPPLSGRQKTALKALAGERDALAEGLQLAPEALAPNRDLELLVRAASGEIIDRPSLWEGWRGAVAIDALALRAEALLAKDGGG